MRKLMILAAALAALVPAAAAAQVAPPVFTQMDDTSRRGTTPTATQCLNAAGTSWVGCQPNRTSSTLATAQVTVITTPTVVATPRAGRLKLTISVGASNSCYYGPPGVTTTTGFAMQPVAGASMTLDYSGALAMVCSASTVVSVAEQY